MGGGVAVQIGLPDDVTISQDLTVTRNLIVQGTASFQHETNLDVADRFIRLASGSSANAGVDTPAAVSAKYIKKGNLFVGANQDIYIYS